MNYENYIVVYKIPVGSFSPLCYGSIRDDFLGVARYQRTRLPVFLPPVSQKHGGDIGYTGSEEAFPLSAIETSAPWISRPCRLEDVTRRRAFNISRETRASSLGRHLSSGEPVVASRLFRKAWKPVDHRGSLSLFVLGTRGLRRSEGKRREKKKRAGENRRETSRKSFSSRETLLVALGHSLFFLQPFSSLEILHSERLSMRNHSQCCRTKR